MSTRHLILILLMGLLAALSGVAHAYDYVPNELLVKYSESKSTLTAAMLARHGCRLVETDSRLGISLIRTDNRVPIDRLMTELRQEPGCVYVERNSIGRGTYFPNDFSFGQQWSMNNSGQTGGKVDADVDSPEAWDRTRGAATVLVAVLDSGVDIDQSEFAGRLLTGYDFVDSDSQPEDMHGHGTEVTGVLIANAGNGVGLAGMDHLCHVLPVRVLGVDNYGTTYQLTQGLRYAADQGARVVNMSLGGYAIGQALADALQYARDAGCILVVASGNSGIGGADTGYPSASPLVISVGATDDNDARWSQSSTGTALDCVAPGADVPLLVRNAPPTSIVYGYGTSYAAPIVSGIASLCLALDPTVGHEMFKSLLIRGCEDYVGPPAEDTTGWDPYFGWGRVNADRTLFALVSNTGTAHCRVAEDATSYSAASTTNDCNNQFLWVGRDAAGAYRSYLRFDMSGIGVIPPGFIVEITSAKLRFYVSDHTGATHSRTLYQVAQDWQACAITWNNQPPVNNVMKQLTLLPVGQYVETTILPDFVESWIQGPNYGMAMTANCEDNGCPISVTKLQSSEGSYKPELVIDYRLVADVSGGPWTVPEPLLSLMASPNPFSRATRLRLNSPTVELAACQVSIVDCAGRIVRRALPALSGAGLSDREWDGLDDDGRRMPSGVYFAVMTTPTQRSRGKLILLR